MYKIITFLWHMFTFSWVNWSCCEAGVAWRGGLVRDGVRPRTSTRVVLIAQVDRLQVCLGPRSVFREPTLESSLLRSWKSLSCGHRLSDISGVDGVDSLKKYKCNCICIKFLWMASSSKSYNPKCVPLKPPFSILNSVFFCLFFYFTGCNKKNTCN